MLVLRKKIENTIMKKKQVRGPYYSILDFLLKHSYTVQLQTITNCILYTASIYYIYIIHLHNSLVVGENKSMILKQIEI